MGSTKKRRVPDPGGRAAKWRAKAKALEARLAVLEDEAHALIPIRNKDETQRLITAATHFLRSLGKQPNSVPEIIDLLNSGWRCIAPMPGSPSVITPSVASVIDTLMARLSRAFKFEGGVLSMDNAECADAKASALAHFHEAVARIVSREMSDQLSRRELDAHNKAHGCSRAAEGWPQRVASSVPYPFLPQFMGEAITKAKLREERKKR